ncbi:MAG: hypothetical protein U1D29_05030 [Burkholderiales bacterium]|nr:hypothetical protein [Burkholderiales bacterium]
MRYMNGAVRATPRTALTQPHTSQPRNADTVTDHSSPTQTAALAEPQGADRPAGSVASTMGMLPSSVA